MEPFSKALPGVLIADAQKELDGHVKRARSIMATLGGLSIVQRVAVYFLVVGIIIGVLGYTNQYCRTNFCNSLPYLGDAFYYFVKDFYGNITMTFIGTALTVLIIDSLNEKRAREIQKSQLIREIGSRDNGLATRAVKELRAQGWVKDGSLRGIRLYKANLEEADLSEGDLQNVDLLAANLKGAYLMGVDLRNASLLCTELQGAILYKVNLTNVEGVFTEQFVSLGALRFAIMPDGKMYDGRYRLPMDLSGARNGQINVNNAREMAEYYAVSEEVYEEGQEWAARNLSLVNSERE